MAKINLTQGMRYDDIIRNFDERLNIIEKELVADRTLRKNYPALKEAWEQYQILKALVQDDLE